MATKSKSITAAKKAAKKRATKTSGETSSRSPGGIEMQREQVVKVKIFSFNSSKVIFALISIFFLVATLPSAYSATKSLTVGGACSKKDVLTQRFFYSGKNTVHCYLVNKKYIWKLDKVSNKIPGSGKETVADLEGYIYPKIKYDKIIQCRKNPNGTYGIQFQFTLYDGNAYIQAYSQKKDWNEVLIGGPTGEDQFIRLTPGTTMQAFVAGNFSGPNLTGFYSGDGPLIAYLPFNYEKLTPAIQMQFKDKWINSLDGVYDPLAHTETGPSPTCTS